MGISQNASFARAILAWYDKHGRQGLPWRQSVSAYRVWVSEIMLQQTQVQTVLPYFERFMQRFPTLEILADAPLDDVLALWSGLGYYARARHLHRCARMIIDQFHGQFPADLATLQTLPGIGRSTAGAILALAYAQRAPILDGNVKRVLARYYAIAGWPGQTQIQKKLWALAEQHTPHKRVHDYTQAMMDLGAMVCTRHQPRCTQCPLQQKCCAYQLKTPTAFPQTKSREALSQRLARFILFTCEDHIYLERRAQTGIWGGLWCLPVCLPRVDLRTWGRYLYGIPIQHAKAWHTFQHTFSHFHLMGEVMHVSLPPTHQHYLKNPWSYWLTQDEISNYGLPAPIKQVLLQWFSEQKKQVIV